MEDIEAVALLQDPVRRRLYEFVVGRGREVGRNEAAEAAGVGRTLAAFLPAGLKGLVYRSAVAATFAASLELVRAGRAELRQDGAFGPIFVKPREGASNPTTSNTSM